MERKLELADIAGYLPYRLRIQHRDLDFVRCVDSVDFTTGDILMYDDSGANYVCITDCLPILRPMSDLVKPMTHPDINNGEEFVPSDLIIKSLTDVSYGGCYQSIDTFADESCIYCLHKARMYHDDCSACISVLSKLHFDYNNLIGQGLAIDINTIK